MLGVSRTTLWRTVKKDPSFPKKRYISPNRVGFVEAEIHEWIEKATQPRTATFAGG
jgi:predicted DNA-binding transcriptional regulator AlpA